MNTKKMFFVLFFIFSCSVLLSNQISHVVIKGDTLWDIAGKYYNNPWFWEKIYQANKEEIKDPHWIFPEQEFILPELTVENTKSLQETTPPEETTSKENHEPLNKEKISEISQEEVLAEKGIPSEQLKIKERQIESLIDIVPLNHKFSGKIVSSKEDKILISQNDTVFVDIGSAQGVKKGTRCYVLKKKGKIKSDKTKRYIGYKVIKLGIIEIIDDIKENSSTGIVYRSYEPISKGDYIQIIEE